MALRVCCVKPSVKMEIKLTNQTNHHRLVSHKGGVWNILSLSESFGSCWANKVKINAYKTIKVFFDLSWISTSCWGFLKPKYEPFITHNRDTCLKQSQRTAGMEGAGEFCSSFVFKRMYRNGSLWTELFLTSLKSVVLHYHWEVLTKVCYRLFMKTLKNHTNFWKKMGIRCPL